MKTEGKTIQELAIALFDLAWLLPRTIGAEQDPAHVLPTSELEIMRLLTRRPGASVNEVAAALRLQPANVSTAIRALEARGLVERRRDGADGRVVRLHPTRQASRRRAVQEANWGDALNEALATLPKSEAARLRSAAPALRALANRLGEQA